MLLGAEDKEFNDVFVTIDNSTTRVLKYPAYHNLNIKALATISHYNSARRDCEQSWRQTIPQNRPIIEHLRMGGTIADERDARLAKQGYL